MLEYDINGKRYQFNAGFAFIKAANSRKQDASGKDVGLLWSMAGVVDRDIERLRDVLMDMNTGREPRLTEAELEAWLESHEDLDKVFVEVSDFFENANCTKEPWKKLSALVELAKATKRA